MSQPQAPGVQVPAAQNIDPNASRPPTNTGLPATTLYPGGYGQAGEPSVNGAGAGPIAAPTTPTPSTSAPGLNLPPGINPFAEQMLRDVNTAVTQAHGEIITQSNLITSIQKDLDKATADGDIQRASQLTTQINAAYSALTQAENRLSQASTAQAATGQKVLDSIQLTPEQANYYRAQATQATATAAKADEETKVLHDGAESQRALTAQQASLASANALLAKTQADVAQAKSPAEINQLNAQADGLRAQAKSTLDLLPGLIQKQAADTSLTTAQTNLTNSNSDLVKAQTTQAQANTDLLKAQSTLQVPAQANLANAQAGLAGAQATQLTPAEAANQASQAQLNLANIQKGIQGPLYGLQDQVKTIQGVIDAVKNQVFGPGGSGDPQHANDLLDQYVTATIGGTTPYAASVAAANAQQNTFQTQAAMANQASQSAASRANAFAGLGGSVLGQLSQMNAYAPKGSTAMAGAFRGVMDEMAQRLGGPQAMAPPPMQQMAPAPELPTFLQGFTAGHRAATATAAQTAQAAGSSGAAAPSININLTGQPQYGAGPGGSVQMPYIPGAPGQTSGASGAGPAGAIPMTGASPPQTGPAPAAPGPTPQQAFAQGYAQNAPTMPNYLQSLVDPMSMLRSAQGFYNQGGYP